MSLIVHGLEEAMRFASGEAEARITIPGKGTFMGRYWPKGTPCPEGWEQVTGDGTSPARALAGGDRILIRKRLPVPV